jgi:hypothetical protein
MNGSLDSRTLEKISDARHHAAPSGIDLSGAAAYAMPWLYPRSMGRHGRFGGCLGLEGISK